MVETGCRVGNVEKKTYEIGTIINILAISGRSIFIVYFPRQFSMVPECDSDVSFWME